MKKRTQNVRTSKTITNTLISLLKEKSFDKITIQDILDKTPVSRATFYAHFHDKYEIIEKLHEYFLKICEDTRTELKEAPPSQAQHIMYKSVSNNRDLVETLLKVRTEHLDLRDIISQNLENEYLQNANSLSRKTEAKIYARARTEAYLSFLYDEKMDYSLEYMNHIYLSVALKLLKLSDDQETIDFLKKKLNLP